MEDFALPACPCLRGSGYSETGVRDVDSGQCSATGSNWCAHTLTVLGPDDTPCSPELCRPGRSCYRQ